MLEPFIRPSLSSPSCISHGSLALLMDAYAKDSGIPEMDVSINDFVINVATANGTGSQSSNLILLNSMFEMGVPVSGKNLFPSNISGFPLVHHSCVGSGYQAPGDKTDIQVLMNADTWFKDIEKVESGS